MRTIKAEKDSLHKGRGSGLKLYANQWMSRSCGNGCGFTSRKGGKVLPVKGWVCAVCVEKMGKKKE